MEHAEFIASLDMQRPPDGLSSPLAALWWAKKDEWDKAHRLVMDEAGGDAAWVHAYLHRVEGDIANANYWYAQARRRPAHGDLDTEWELIVVALLRC